MVFEANLKQFLGPSVDSWLSLLQFLHVPRLISTRPSKDHLNLALWAFSHYTFSFVFSNFVNTTGCEFTLKQHLAAEDANWDQGLMALHGCWDCFKEDLVSLLL